MRRCALRATLVAIMATLSACQEPERAAHTTPATAPANRQDFLARGHCAGRDAAGAYREADCADDHAVARVLARYNGPQATGPRCPEPTDFVLHIAAVEQGDSERSSAPEGYACMRNLRPPHPGDPGQGGGPLTVTGDCVRSERDGVVKETACDGSGAHAPEYRVTDEVPTRDGCPPSTDLYVQVGGENPVGCARRLP
ncbi:hypothetical protein [Streptomyces sp. UNOC14_S4]|uniref:hypothetical protein n=1 Tax=Streptomyces sp. UNOC14_S4 TaxID=2872340 RepID=UPI001E3B0342|nr:hypothetical protein [Streptomyces sp. UNOC14_S4]MCC3768731.1 hypothetical protein [Streptomyces sp. UNOC14_S4]